MLPAARTFPSEQETIPEMEEEFIAVLYEDEMWMGLVDFKGDDPIDPDTLDEPELGIQFCECTNELEMTEEAQSSSCQER